jgi:hypothetical protein
MALASAGVRDICSIDESKSFTLLGMRRFRERFDRHGGSFSTVSLLDDGYRRSGPYRLTRQRFQSWDLAVVDGPDANANVRAKSALQLRARRFFFGNAERDREGIGWVIRFLREQKRFLGVTPLGSGGRSAVVEARN